MIFIREGYKWIQSIYSGIYIECVGIRKMCTENVWDSYRALSAMGSDEFTEVIAMNKALVELRKTISGKQRPGFFRRKDQRVEARKRK